MLKKKVFLLCILLLFLSLLTSIVRVKYKDISPPLKQDKEITAVTFLINLLGEFRSTVAAIFYIKSENYFHEMEAVQNWKEQTENMPLFRLVTLLDPHLIQAYDTGAYHLAMNLNKIKEGLEFLEEGLANNPQSADLHFTAAIIHYIKTKNDDEVVRHTALAEEFAHDSLMRANAMRLKGYAFYRQKKFKESLSAFQELLRIKPDDMPATRKLEELKRLLIFPNTP